MTCTYTPMLHHCSRNMYWNCIIIATSRFIWFQIDVNCESQTREIRREAFENFDEMHALRKRPLVWCYRKSYAAKDIGLWKFMIPVYANICAFEFYDVQNIPTFGRALNTKNDAFGPHDMGYIWSLNPHLDYWSRWFTASCHFAYYKRQSFYRMVKSDVKYWLIGRLCFSRSTNREGHPAGNQFSGWFSVTCLFY